HLGGEDFAYAALEREPPVSGARPWRTAAALGGEVEQPAVLQIVQLRAEEAAPVAKFGVVDLELMPVIAQGERGGMAVGQGSEASEMVDPFCVRQASQP